jgi:HemY protein
MRWLTTALLLALAAAAVALVLRIDAGNVAFLVHPYRIDLSLNLLVLLLLLLLAIAFFFARAVQSMVDFPQQVRAYRARREQARSQQALVESIKSLLEGRFARAEKSARAAQSSPVTAGVSALIGARAAHRMQEYGRRDEWLKLAEEDTALNTARLVTSAEMLTEHRENEQALAAIDRLQGAGARHIHAMRIALNANLQSGRWDDAIKAIRALEKRNALHPLLARKLKLAVYREQLAVASQDASTLEHAWRTLPEKDRHIPEVALEGARLFNNVKRGQLAALAIEEALAGPPALWDPLAERLLDEYARAQSFPARDQLERAESWLRQAPHESVLRAPLLRTAGLVCLREQLWGKAKEYLADSAALQPHPSTHLALARVAEAVDDAAEAAVQYREAALAYSRLQAETATETVPMAIRASPRELAP